jgi:di/tricarboxylate transporter
MKKKVFYSLLAVLFLVLAAAVGIYKPSPVLIAFSLVVLCLFAMLGFGWISARKKES